VAQLFPNGIAEAGDLNPGPLRVSRFSSEASRAYPCPSASVREDATYQPSGRLTGELSTGKGGKRPRVAAASFDQAAACRGQAARPW
jgi:hypothetical protein